MLAFDPTLAEIRKGKWADIGCGSVYPSELVQTNMREPLAKVVNVWAGVRGERKVVVLELSPFARIDATLFKPTFGTVMVHSHVIMGSVPYLVRDGGIQPCFTRWPYPA